MNGMQLSNFQMAQLPEGSYPYGAPGYGSVFGASPMAVNQAASTGYPSAPTFNYPMPGEVWNTMSNLWPMQQQQSMLSNMQSPSYFMQAVKPYVQSALNAVGRSNIPSSSYADKLISSTLGSLWAQNQMNVLGGLQNYAQTMGGLGSLWYQPYNAMMGTLI